MTQRPRPSVLSLFDPLSSSSSSSQFSSPTDSDKENDCNDDSFLHLRGSQMQVYSPVRKLRRRLIDVGDMTVDEPDIRDLIEEEEELNAEIKQSFAVDEDENATLTFRDMAKAATPKWSAQRAVTWATSKTLSTPRTPLAEMAPKDEITPMGRKKMFRRQVPFVSKAHQCNNAALSEATSPAVRSLINVQECPTSLAMPVPSIEISCDNEMANSHHSSKSEVISAVSESLTRCATLISDTSNPIFASNSSLPSATASAVGASPYLSDSRLRPNARLNHPNRHSVDLQSSFQLHFHSSETTFDLINDKISFFGSSNDMDFFSESTSFNDGFGPDCHDFMHESEQKMSSKERIDAYECDTPNETKHDCQEGRHSSTFNTNCTEIKDRTTPKIAPSPVPTCNNPNNAVVLSESEISLSKPECSIVSTPSSRPAILVPPRPVAALKIMKRTKTVDQEKATGPRSNPGGSRRTSSVATISVPASQVLSRSSLEKVLPIPACKVTENNQGPGGIKRVADKKQIVSSVAQSEDGPRRVLVNDAPKVKPLLKLKGQTNSTQVKNVALGGPRRIPASEFGNTIHSMKSTLNNINPAKCSTIGTSGTTAIPRPVNRNSGSKIPAPSGGKQRFGVQTESNEGFLGRRAT